MIFKTNFDTYSLLGRNVEGFYLEEKGKDKKQLLSVKPKLEDDVLSLSYENRPYYIDNQIRYIVNNKEKKISLEFATDVIYNGQYATQNTGQFLQLSLIHISQMQILFLIFCLIRVNLI